MGLLNNLFKNKKKLNQQIAKGMNVYVPYFSGSYDAEANTTYVSICENNARHLSKIKPKVFKGEDLAASKKYINDVLGLRMNPITSATLGWEQLAKDYFTVNNAIAFIEWDYTDYREPLKAIWPLDPDKNSMSVRTVGQEVYVRFRLNGSEYTVSLEDLIFIPRNAKPSTLFGQSSAAIDQVLKLIQTNYEGIEQAIKTSAFIRFIIQSTTPLNDDVKKQKAKAFADAYLGSDATGVAYVDGAQEIKQISSEAKYANAAEQKIYTELIYQYLGSNEKILRGDFTEDQWQSFWETELEPFILKLMDELNYKILSKGERSAGNKIVIDTNRLQTASMKTRIMVADRYLKLPVIKPNVVTDLLYLPKSESGDEEYTSLNYTETKNLGEYQGVGGPGEETPAEPKEDDPGGDQNTPPAEPKPKEEE
jgi:HK97 family phage portal protein